MQIEMLAANDRDQASEGLAAVLLDCVDGGASVGFLAPLAAHQAKGFWRDALLAPTTLIWTASDSGRIVGTVQLKLATFPNAAHRAEVAKLLVHRDARGHGVGAALMAALEAEASHRGRTLLLLDTQTGSDAERLYRRLGWHQIGIVADHAATPDGRLGPTTLMANTLSAHGIRPR